MEINHHCNICLTWYEYNHKSKHSWSTYLFDNIGNRNYLSWSDNFLYLTNKKKMKNYLLLLLLCLECVQIRFYGIQVKFNIYFFGQKYHNLTRKFIDTYLNPEFDLIPTIYSSTTLLHPEPEENFKALSRYLFTYFYPIVAQISIEWRMYTPVWNVILSILIIEILNVGFLYYGNDFRITKLTRFHFKWVYTSFIQVRSVERPG